MKQYEELVPQCNLDYFRIVHQLLERGTSAQLPNTAATLSDMKSLCLALLEALGDKTLALAHQKKANR